MYNKHLKELIRCGCVLCKTEVDRRMQQAQDLINELWADADERNRLVSELRSEGLEQANHELLSSEDEPPGPWFR
jgi:hypothetical protein